MNPLAQRSTLKFLGIRSTRTADPLVEAPAIGHDSVVKLKSMLDLDDAGTAALTGTSLRTYHRRKQHDAPLAPGEADAVLRVARLVDEAITTFGDAQRAVRWLKTPSPVLNGMPLELIASDAGAQAVHDELIRIRWGDYA